MRNPIPLFVCLAAALLGVGCPARDDGSSPEPLLCENDGLPLPAFAATGPRDLPPTFVPLEIGAFPRPADEACAGNVEIAVAAGESIAEALALATSGTTLTIAPGTYVEGEGGYALEWSTPGVCLRAQGSGEVVLRAAPDQDYGLVFDASNTVVEGLTLRGFRYAVSLNGGIDDGSTQSNVTLERLRLEEFRGSTSDGIVAYGDNTADGGAPTVDGLLLLDVVVDGASLGVSCNAGPCEHWWLERVRVLGTNADTGNSGADAFAIESGRQIAVVDSEFLGAEADGIDTKAEDVVIFGARVAVGRNGIKLWHGGDVIDSAITECGGDGCLIGDQSGRYRYLHVLATHYGDPGEPAGYLGTWGYDVAVADTSFSVEIVNSIFAENALPAGFYFPAEAAVSIRNSMFDDVDAKLVDLSDGTSLLVSELAAFEAGGRGSGNVVGTALFEDDDCRRLVLPGTSPARDTAETIPALDRDILGNARVAGAGADLGPFESP